MSFQPSAVLSFQPSIRLFALETYSMSILDAVSPQQSLLNSSDPRHEAFQWVTTSANLSSSALDIVQGYVLSLIYFAMGGEHWLDTRNFTHNLNVCSWNNAGSQTISKLGKLYLDLFILSHCHKQKTSEQTKAYGIHTSRPNSQVPWKSRALWWKS